MCTLVGYGTFVEYITGGISVFLELGSPSIHQFLVAFCDLCNNMYQLELRKKFQLSQKRSLL